MVKPLHKGNVCFLALAVMLHVSIGMHIVHPWLHGNHLPDRGVSNSPTGQRADPEIGVPEDHGHAGGCPVCRFLSTYQAPHLLAPLRSLALSLLTAVLVVSVSIASAAPILAGNPRAPPLA